MKNALAAAAQLEGELVPESVLGVYVVGLHKPDYTNPHISNHKAKFEEWLFNKYEKKGLRCANLIAFIIFCSITHRMHSEKTIKIYQFLFSEAIEHGIGCCGQPCVQSSYNHRQVGSAYRPCQFENAQK